MGVRDHDACDVPERVSGGLDTGFDSREPAVGDVRTPHTAVDQGDAVAVGEDVHVHAVDGVDADGKRDPRQTVEAGGVDTGIEGRLARQPAHPCMRSRSVNQTRSCTS
jgi:hypothetical protein